MKQIIPNIQLITKMIISECFLPISEGHIILRAWCENPWDPNATEKHENQLSSQCPFKRKPRQDVSYGRRNRIFDSKITLWFEVEDTGSSEYSTSHAIWNDMQLLSSEGWKTHIDVWQELIQVNGSHYLKVLSRLIHQLHESKQSYLICCSRPSIRKLFYHFRLCKYDSSKSHNYLQAWRNWSWVMHCTEFGVSYLLWRDFFNMES